MYRLIVLFFGFVLTTSAFANSTIVVLGDSLSAGFGLANGEAWVDLLQIRLQEKNLNYRVVNASISGDTTSGGKDRIAQVLQTHKPEVVIVELGGNDGLRGLSLTEMQQNLETISEQCQRSGAKVLLIGMQIPPNYGIAYVQRFNKTFESVAKKYKTAVVPFFLEGIEDNLDYFQRDQIHPNSKAQPLLLDNVWPELKKLLYNEK